MSEGVQVIAREPIFDLRSKPPNFPSAEHVFVWKLPGAHLPKERAAMMANYGDDLPRGQDLVQRSSPSIRNSVRARGARLARRHDSFGRGEG